VSNASRHSLKIANFRVITKYVRRPHNDTEFKEYQAAIGKYAQSCIDLSTPKGIVSHIGTAETVQDWNSLRDALDYQQFHFLAWS
jgi:hypothetical protein